MTAAIVADLTPAPFDPNARGHAHAAWTWTVQMHATNATWSLQQLTDGQLRDVELAHGLFGALIGAERGRRRAALASALLTPDSVSGGVA